ncbi:MAG: hypothetical protein RL434_92 [Pseudomonadota bacterium]
MRRMRAVVLVLTALLSPVVMALGLGPLETRSSLNEPFEARIAFTGSTVKDFDTLKASLADTAQFERAGIPRESVLLMLRFEVVADEPGAEYLRIRSLDPVREPYLNFLIELDWANGRIVREYTVLLDPPEYARAGPAPVAAPVMAAGPALVATAPPPAAPEPGPSQETTSAPAPSIAGVAPLPAEAAQGGITVPAGGTAWELALDYRPDRSISVHQMMIALVRANPEAFLDGNVNRLRRGVVLRMPERSEIEALDPPAATAEFERQTEAWRALRQSLATPVAEPAPVPATPTPSATAEASAPAATETAPATPAETGEAAEAPAPEPDAEVADLEAIIDEAAADAAADAAPEETATADAADASGKPDALEEALEREARLELSAPETEDASEAPGNDAKGTADPALAMESADVSARENAELEARLTEAEQIIDLLQRQLKVKDEELAALQAKAERAQAAPPPPAVEPPGLLDSLVPEALRDALPGGAATVVGILVLLIVLLALLIQRAASGRRSVLLPAPGEGSTQHPIAGDAGALELPQGTWAPEPVPELAVEEISAAEAEALARTGGREQAPAEVAPPPPEDELDEVNVFLAYERFEQAEARVREAIKSHPQHHPYKLRLLEVLYAANRLQAYEQAARELHTAVGGAGDLWQGAVAMWHEMSPERELFAPASGRERADTEQRPSTTFLDISAPAPMSEAAPSTAATEPPSEEELARLGDTQVFLPTSVEPPAPPLDLDLGGGQGTDSATPASAFVDISSAEAPDSADTTFIDLNFDEPQAAARPAGLRGSADGAEFDLSDTVSPGSRPRAASAEPDAQDLTLDFDLAMGETQAPLQSAGGLGATAEPAGLEATRFEVTRFDASESAVPEIDLSLDETRQEAAPGSLADFAEELDLSLEDTTEFPPPGGYPEVTLPAPDTTVGESLADITRSMEASIASLDVDVEGDSVLNLSLEPEDEGSDLELDFTLDGDGTARMVDTMALDPDALRKSAEARNRAELALQGDEEESSPLHQTDTKLNLARAYIELGDADGARQILEEVLQTGNATQLEEARRLLAQIA